MLKSCFLSSFIKFHSVVSKEKSKMSQPISGQGGHLDFPIGPKNTNLVEDVEILLPVMFHWIPFGSFRGEIENVSANQWSGRPSCFSDRSENTNLVEDVDILLPVKFRLIPFSGFRGEVKNVSVNHRQGRPSCFSDRSENTNLVEDVDILLPVKFGLIPFSGFRGEVKNVSANQRPGWSCCFSDRPQKNKLGKGCWDLASCQVHFIEFGSAVSEEKSKMSPPIRGQGGHFVFSWRWLFGPFRYMLIQTVWFIV